MITGLSVELPKAEFQALLEKAAIVVPTRDIMPVLKNFRLEVSEKGIQVSATDLELSVVVSAGLVSSAAPGTAVLPARKMLEILREADDGDLLIKVRGDSATVSVGRATWTLRLQRAQDYPALPSVGSVELHPVSRDRFLHAIQAVQYAAGKDATRPTLMMLDVSGGKMTACDGRRFQQASLGDDFPVSMQLPIGAVGDLVKLLRSADQETVSVGETEFHLVFEVGQDVFIVNKLMTEFPDVEEILLRPAESNRDRLSVARSALDAAVKRVRINADPDVSAVALELARGKLTVSSRDRHGNASNETVEASWDGEERSVVVNHSFLIDMLAMHGGESCNFLLGEDTKSRKSPVVLRDDDAQTIGIIYQMRQDWNF